MTVATTSLFAWNKLRHELGARQSQVLSALEEFGAQSNQELADRLKLPINCITGRVKELRGKGLVERDHVGVGKFGNVVNFWRAVEEQKELSNG